ncbi:hypothetical protein [Paenibacillus agricola]|uniref:Uncharacterized protein n=1 Tax=Paenibacillus agricola TaxID=2716264 RepID=A0ABX0JG41_9BACL|nr:hypothetical protein [Paenibacillus agricola]NHN33673.1 hypothetical protein [Paenibacillus agricola]
MVIDKIEKSIAWMLYTNKLSLKKRASTFQVFTMLAAFFPNVFTYQQAAAAGALPDETLPR